MELSKSSESKSEYNSSFLISGQLIQDFNWGPSQPNGGDQHCMYIVGGYLGYQWADFHCGFEMTFLCEFEVNDIEAWRRRRQMIQKYPLLQKRRLIEDSEKRLTGEDDVNIRYGYHQTNSSDLSETFSKKVPKTSEKSQQDNIQGLEKSVLVTQKPYRNSVLISTKKSTGLHNSVTTGNKINVLMLDKNETRKDSDWTVYNFLKSVVKFG